MPKCPKGKILRDGYTRKAYTKSDGTRVKASYVPPTCVPDKGAPGKTKPSQKVLPKPTPGALGKYGYSNVKNTTAKVRREALTRAVKATDYATIVRRVNLVANYNKVSDPRTHEIMRSDIAWMQRNLAPIYAKTAARKGSKKASKRGSKRGSKTKGSKLVKAGKATVGGRSRQLFHVPGSASKFYRYRKRDGTFGRRYVK